MCEKYNPTKKNNVDMLLLIEKKIEFFKDVIQKTIIHVQENKFLDILGISDVSHCIEILGELSKKIEDIATYNTIYKAIKIELELEISNVSKGIKKRNFKEKYIIKLSKRR